MTGLVHQYGYLAVVVIVGLESLGIPLPGETTLITAALYAGISHQLNIEVVILAAIAGAIIGDNVGFLIGHWGGYRLLVRWGHVVRLDQTKVKLARLLFARYGGRVVFFGRFVSVLRAYAAFLAGTSRMPWRRFLVFNAAGGIVWATLYGAAAYLLGSAVERASGTLAIIFGVLAAVVIMTAVILVRREERRLEAIAEDAFPGPLEGYPGGPPL